MQIPWAKQLKQCFDAQPTVGALVDLCEENYDYLLRMAPDIAQMQGVHRSRCCKHTDLYLEIIEQSKYTTIVHLTYYLDHEGGQRPDPDSVLRVYHDARQVEVISLNQKVLPVDRLYEAPGLINKWRVNQFISKWLSFCVGQNHCFDQSIQPALAFEVK